MEEPDRIWDRDLTLSFIKLVREFPCLYDQNDPTYADKIHKRKVLMYCAKELSAECSFMTVQSIKRKLRTLHEQVKRERIKIQRANEQNVRYRPTLWCFHEVSFMWKENENRDKNNEVAADTDIDALMTENSANGWKGTAFSSDVSETETNAHDWKTTSKPTEHIVKKRKVQLNNVETENNQQSNGYLSSLATSSKDTAPFDWTANNGMHGRSVSYEGTANNQENTFQKDAVMETLEVCKTLLQKQTHKNNTQSREEIFCNYLCTELKKVTSDKIFQKLKLDILQLVNIALDADRVPTGSEIIQEIKVEPEIMIDSNS